jgi:hypothetical protein
VAHAAASGGARSVAVYGEEPILEATGADASRALEEASRSGFGAQDDLRMGLSAVDHFANALST